MVAHRTLWVPYRSVVVEGLPDRGGTRSAVRPSRWQSQARRVGRLWAAEGLPPRALTAATTRLFEAIVESLDEDGPGGHRDRLAPFLGAAHRHVVGTIEEFSTGAQQHLVMQDRREVARELHDMVGGHMVLALRHLDPDGPVRIAQARDTLAIAVADTRRIAAGLRAGSNGIGEAGIQRFLEDFVQAYAPAEMSVSIVLHGDDRILSRDVRRELLLVLREGLINGFRHSGGLHMSVTGAIGPDQVIFEITDDGCGVADPGGPGTDPHSTGIESMTERIKALGGQLTLERNSTEGGLRVRICLPRSPRRGNDVDVDDTQDPGADPLGR